MNRSMDDNMALIDWGELNGDLLDLILSKLFGKDRVSFSLVSKHWNAVAATSPYGCSPCLMYYYWRTRNWKFYQYNTFFSMSFPDLENAEIRCSKYGWLLMLRYDDTLFFFDPSNNRKVELPCKVGADYFSLSFFNPPTSPECVVVGINTLGYHLKVEICTLKHGEDEWDIVISSYTYILREQQDIFESLGAPALHHGLMYFLSVEGDVLIFDMKQQRLDIHFKCWRDTNFVYDIKEQYLVKVDGDEALYGVFVFDDEREVHVYRLSSDMKWDMVEEGTGDKVFYLSNMSSFAVKATSKSMENTIYFPMFYGDVPVFYSLSDEKYHSIDGGYLESNVYGLKRLNRAAWVTPMPVQEDITTMSWALANS